ncbi:ras-related protein Rab-38 isoform X2 [Coccinella septempunctata]|uniref:ras-related protein Rab-38 isoform X2 n=1 Tax=Coccinella septempunctata TaxID=41139 RepID=UPI001D0797D1|nr:ras-related protein Rab-38 isoform X2 [Coccinella septempunctata]
MTDSRKISRRTRAQRTMRRERYFLRQDPYEDFSHDSDFSIEGSPLFTSSRKPSLENGSYFLCDHTDTSQSRTSGHNQLSSANQTQIRRRDHLYKVLVIGDLATGKTSIIKRYVHRFFSQNYRATIGVDFALKVINWDENTVIRLQLWDIAGQERYGNMTRVYFKEAVGAFIVFDCTRMNTFESVKNWKTDLDSKVLLADGSKIPCVLLANKCDQPKEGIVNNSHQMDEYCKTEGFAAWFATSAKDNINIDEAAKVLIERILEKESVLTVNKDGDQFSIQEDNQEQNQGKKKCLC